MPTGWQTCSGVSLVVMGPIMLGWQAVLGPSVSNRDPLVKLLKTVLAFIIIIAGQITEEGVEK